MPTRPHVMIALFILGSIQISGCGSKSPGTGAATAVAAATADAAENKESSKAAPPDATAPPAGAVPCMVAAPGIDYQGNASGYMFIGEHPACTSASDLQNFCTAMQTRNIFEKLEDADKAAEGAPAIAATLPEESRAQFLGTYPKNVLQLSAQKCGLSMAAIRSKLVAEADAAMKTDNKSDQYTDARFILQEDPAYAETLWKRECGGRVKLVVTHSEMGDHFDVARVNPGYADFCTQSSEGDGSRFKRPPAASAASSN